MAIADNIISIARRHLGEKESDGDNHGAVVDWAIAPWTRHAADDPTMPDGWAKWCAAFCSTVVLEALADRQGPLLPEDWRRMGSLSCDRLWANLQANGWVFRLGYGTPQPGDLCFEQHGKDVGTDSISHVGLVESVEDGAVVTIEGNENNAVMRERRVLGAGVYGFGRVGG